jgi:hypothetical protein
VTHLDVSAEQAREAAQVVRDLLVA